MLIGIDGSSVRTGFAVGGEQSERPRTGVWELPGAADHVFDRTLGVAAQSLAALIRLTGAKAVCVESPIMVSSGSNAHSIAALLQLYGAFRSVIHQCGARFIPAHSATVRKFFVGNGALKSAEAKDAVMRRCEQLGWDFSGHDAADAAATWAYGMSIVYPAWSPLSTPLFGRAE